MSNNSYTFQLFKRTPDFLNGLSSSLDFFGIEEENYNTSETEEIADSDSIYSDWQAIGDDMRRAFGNFK